MVGIIYSLVAFISPITTTILPRFLAEDLSLDALPTLGSAENRVNIITVEELWQPHEEE